MWLPCSATVVLLIAGLLTLSGCGLSRGTDLGDLISGPTTPEPSYPAIIPIDTAPPHPDVTITWQFEGREVSVTVPVDGAVLEGARGARKTALVSSDTPEAEWSRFYYLAFMSDKHQAPLYAAFAAELHQLRDELDLDSDRYVELVSAMAQGLEYQTSELNPAPKFPIETVADNAGDCDDKTLLAAALLAFEGYDVVLLEFSTESHMALGIATNGSTYKSSGYALVETTIESLVGWHHRDAQITTAEGQRLTTDPRVLDVSDGPRAYGAGRLVDTIRRSHDDSVTVAGELEVEASAARTYANELEGRVEALRKRMEADRDSGDVDAYNERVPEYNRLVREYNVAIDAYNELVAEQQKTIEAINRIRDGQTDRHGLTTWLSGR